MHRASLQLDNAALNYSLFVCVQAAHCSKQDAKLELAWPTCSEKYLDFRASIGGKYVSSQYVIC